MLTRKFLASKGIEADVIDEIIAAHTETTSALKDKLDEAEKYKAKAEKYDEAEKELNDLKAEVAKNGDKDYDALKKEFEDYKAEVANKETRTAKENAYKEILKDAGRISAELAKAKAETEFEKYRIVQDRLYQSDFDHFLELEEKLGDKKDKRYE